MRFCEEWKMKLKTARRPSHQLNSGSRNENPISIFPFKRNEMFEGRMEINRRGNGVQECIRT